MNTSPNDWQKDTVSESDIATHARERWLAAGSPQGRDLDFWFQAERELRSARQTDQPAWSPQKLMGDTP
ncbi:DUF2934 domain-containing protein [Roseimicrobium sp. ORNL1]|uniref:DUF2934 domain-containing protein n=1 Tax=Roseimicrobium sp. ORNL1 TaxID=2711231 RepID=UPI0013E1D4F4|nr:DUF2934 domain-containing protein [Roseimicrobium sp. ORNL1]QIF01636.1 DUF2934 domain-containing protein [Roseimicrobium sp. ORNL1]